MAKTFNVAKNKFSDQLSDSTFATNVKTWLDSLSIGDSSSYTIQIEHRSGFWVIVIVHE